MRALVALALAALCACSSTRPAATPAGAPCDVLPLLGRAVPLALAGDPSGGIALAGELVAGSLRGGSARLDVPGGFLLRADAGGAVAWIRGLGPARPLAVAVAPDGGVVAVGSAQGRCFATRVDAQGRELWTTALAGEGESSCRALAVDGRSGAIWAGGEFSGAAGPVRSAGLSDALVLRIAGESGEMRLARTFGGKGPEQATAIAVAPSGEVVVAGSFGGGVDAAVDFGRGVVRGRGGTDAFLLLLDGETLATRSASIVGEYGDDEIVALALRGGGVFAAANVHRERKGAPCGGQVLLLRNGDWVRVTEEECLAARGLAFDGSGRLWLLENAGRTLLARAFSPGDGELLGTRSWEAGPAGVRGAGIAEVPGGFALAATAFGELVACGKPIGSNGEQTAFVAWVRDLAKDR